MDPTRLASIHITQFGPHPRPIVICYNREIKFEEKKE